MASTELSLECKVQSYSTLLKYSFGDGLQTYDKLQDFVSRLEEERLKIDVFKRELPLCMQLLTNAVETSRRQLQTCKTIQAGPPKPVLEEFIPLKNSTPPEDQKPPTISDKASWMTSVQLWSQAGDLTKQQSTVNESPKKDANLDTKQRINGGAFLPFNKERNSFPGLGLAAEKEMAEMKLFEKADKNVICSSGRENSSHKSGSGDGVAVVMEQRIENVAAELGSVETTSCTTTSTNTTTTTQTHRKARRCWSPDLHRRFVNALQMLGGSQVATPKQIRELMKVDGLTNDEVKSHLQKYRLHTRRPSPNPQATGTAAAQLVVLGVGGIWVPPEYAAAAAAAQSGATALYGPPPTSHPASHFFAPPPPPTPLPQEFYTTTPPHQHPSFQHPLHFYKGATPQTTQSSPESDIRGTGDRSESFEDEKSGSSSWRTEGGGNGDERIRKGSCGRRSEEGEESNGSEMTLKFEKL